MASLVFLSPKCVDFPHLPDAAQRDKVQSDAAQATARQSLP